MGAASPASAHEPKNYVEAREHVKDRLISQLGAPYRYGSESPRNGFDCSGLVYWAFKKHGGDDLERSSSAMWAQRTDKGFKRIRSMENLEIGDLLFYNTSGSGVSHVSTYIGRGKMIHAGSGRGNVSKDPVDYPYYKQRFIGAMRIPALRKPDNR
jgi:cell wall-associated NlpC family hydrolase